MDKVEIILEPEDNNRLLNLCGPLNNNLKELELRFDVEINQRGNLFYFAGNHQAPFTRCGNLRRRVEFILKKYPRIISYYR